MSLQTHPDAKPFRNKGWEHCHKMDELMFTQRPRGTNAFHARQGTVKSEQVPPDDDQANGCDIQPVAEDEGEPSVEEEQERAVGTVIDKGKMVAEREVAAEDDDKDDIIP